MRNQGRNVGYQQGILVAQADNNRDQCESNANQSAEPYRSDALAVCAARWPANLASTIPVQNLSKDYIQSGAAFATPAQVAASAGYVPPAPSGQAVINSSGAAKTPAETPASTPSTGFDLNAMFACADATTCWFGFPKWAVIGVAGAAAFFMFKGAK